MKKKKDSTNNARGERMIEIKVRFWTNDISPTAGGLLPKHAWSSGVVRMDRNASHDLNSADPIPFNSLLDLPTAIEKLLIRQRIQLHASRKMRKYFLVK